MTKKMDLSLEDVSGVLAEVILDEVRESAEQEVRKQTRPSPLMNEDMILQKIKKVSLEKANEVSGLIKDLDWCEGVFLIIQETEKINTGLHGQWLVAIDNMREKASEFLEKENGESEPDLQKMAALSDEAMALGYEVALSFYEADECEKAIRVTSALNFFSPYYSNVWFLQGLCYEELGNFNRAIDAFKSCLELDADQAMPCWHLALNYNFLDLHDLCDEYVQRARKARLSKEDSLDEIEEIEQQIQVGGKL